MDRRPTPLMPEETELDNNAEELMVSEVCVSCWDP